MQVKPRLVLASLWHSVGIALFILLSSCSSHRKDGPPSFYVDETRIPDAVPKLEPLAKYGNKPTYYVFGKKYHVLPSSRHYEAIGTASWYGTKFHSRLTSSGERYNMLAMTAAHKSLPLPTYVQVTNLHNGRQVIVKVNDRGPFVGDRLIDLSFVAAKKLGMFGHGTAKVKIKAIDPDQYHHQLASAAYPTPPVLQAIPSHMTRTVIKPSPPSDKLIYVQAGAFNQRNNAERLREKLTKVTAIPVVIANTYQSHIYKVQLGPISNQQAVTKLMTTLKAMGIHANTLVAH